MTTLQALYDVIKTNDAIVKSEPNQISRYLTSLQYTSVLKEKWQQYCARHATPDPTVFFNKYFMYAHQKIVSNLDKSLKIANEWAASLPPPPLSPRTRALLDEIDEKMPDDDLGSSDDDINDYADVLFSILGPDGVW